MATFSENMVVAIKSSRAAAALSSLAAGPEGPIAARLRWLAIGLAAFGCAAWQPSAAVCCCISSSP